MSTSVAASGWPEACRSARALRAAAPALLFGLRLWASVCLALYVAFWLQLDNAYWAGTTAAIVCQPSLGASLRKGWFRMVGTTIGAVAIVMLTAWFPQARAGFLLGLALWCAACGLAATLLRNFAAYGAVLAGLTAAIIASDELGATGGANGGEVFSLAVARASEICIGIICAGLVLAATDLGDARRRLAAQFAAISAEIAGGFAGMFSLTGSDVSETRPILRDLVRRVVALDPVIDQAFGEDSDLRFHAPVLRAAVDGLFAALSGWRMATLHLEQLPIDQGRREADIILANIPQELRSAPAPGDRTIWIDDPSSGWRACSSAVRSLTALPARTPSLRLLADRTADALIGIKRALDGLLMLVDSGRNIPTARSTSFRLPDLLPSLINAVRVLVTIGAAELFWITTAWPNGAQAIAFAAIGVILFATRGDQAYTATMGFLVGVCLCVPVAAILKFAVLPDIVTFVGFSLVIGLVLVPAGALMMQPWNNAIFMVISVYLMPLIAPANPMTYDTEQFYNSALAIVTGLGASALAFRLLPPLSPELRTRRLLARTLRDLRRLTTSVRPRKRNDWESLIYSRLSALPEQAEPLQRAQLLAALSTGIEIIRLRRIARRFDQQAELAPVLDAVAKGESSIAVERLRRLDRMLAGLPRAMPGARIRLRARGGILAMSESLARHAAYFDSGSAR
jgi:uncharacterized membrane protein YccC